MAKLPTLSKLSSLLTRRVIVAGALVGVAGTYYYVVGRRAFHADVRTICTAESGTETNIVNSRLLIEGNTRKALKSGEGVELLDRLKAAAPDAASRQLRKEADGAGVADCPAAASYDTLSKRTALARNAERMCLRLDPAELARVPKASRFDHLRGWVHSNVDDAPLDELLAAADVGAPADKVIKLRASLSDVGVHNCGMMSGLVSSVDPTPGPNAFLKSAAVQDPKREPALLAALKDKVPAFRDCYATGLKVNSSISGTMVMKFRLSTSGAIDFATVQDDSTLLARGVVACMVDAVKSVRIDAGPAGAPESPGGLSVVFWVAQ